MQGICCPATRANLSLFCRNSLFYHVQWYSCNYFCKKKIYSCSIRVLHTLLRKDYIKLDEDEATEGAIEQRHSLRPHWLSLNFSLQADCQVLYWVSWSIHSGLTFQLDLLLNMWSHDILFTLWLYLDKGHIFCSIHVYGIVQPSHNTWGYLI